MRTQAPIYNIFSHNNHLQNTSDFCYDHLVCPFTVMSCSSCKTCQKMTLFVLVHLKRHWKEQGSFWQLDGCLSDSLLVNLELLLRVRYDVGFISLRANLGTYQCHCGDKPSSKLYCYSNTSSKGNLLRAVISSAQVSNEIVVQNSQRNSNTMKIKLQAPFFQL